MTDPLNGKRLCVRRSEKADYEMWRTTDSTLAAVALDPYVNAFTNTLADALAEVAPLYNVNGALCRLTNGKLTRINPQLLSELIAQHIAVHELVNRGTDADPNWTIEYTPLVLKPQNLTPFFTTEKRQGSLTARVTKV